MHCHVVQVFLIDFFANSPVSAEWHVLLQYLEELEVQVCGAPD